MARKYTKTSDHWDRIKAKGPAPTPIVVNAAPPAAPARVPVPFPDVSYGATELSRAADINGGAVNTSYRGRQLNNGLTDAGAYQNLRALPLAWVSNGEGRAYVGASDAIDLCMRAWCGVPIVRNAVEVAVEFSSQPLYVKSANATVQTFFREWFQAVQMNRLKEQFFREYYRSGNVFLYRFDGRFGPAYYKHFQQSFGAKENRVPIRYELLNPCNVFVPNGLVYPYTYTRLLSTYEIERLRNPLTEQDKQVYENLPEEAKQQIRNASQAPLGIYLQMDPKRLRFAFYKKQDYEPLAVPMIYPVLPDVEWKLALKKMDMALARTIEHAILLVKTGEAPNEYNGGNGINQNNITRLQALFSNQTIGRVLVADYTTTAEWLIPDIKEILGPEKYVVANADIQEGLQSIWTGDDKFANAQIKVKIFIQRLEEGQNRFLNDFLMPEILQICEIMGFRTVPEVGFQKIDLQDEAVMSRVYQRMAELGLLTAEELTLALNTGILPDAQESLTSQKAYKAARDKGLYEPLIGGAKDAGETGRPGGSGGGKQSGTRKSSPIGTSKGQDAFSIRAYADCLRESQDLITEMGAALCKRFKVKKLDKDQVDTAVMLAKKIMTLQPRDQWKAAIAATIDAPPAIPTAIGRELDEISMDYGVDGFDAILLRHCRTQAPTENRE